MITRLNCYVLLCSCLCWVSFINILFWYARTFYQVNPRRNKVTCPFECNTFINRKISYGCANNANICINAYVIDISSIHKLRALLNIVIRIAIIIKPIVKKTWKGTTVLINFAQLSFSTIVASYNFYGHPMKTTKLNRMFL